MAFADLLILVLALIVSGIGALLVAAWAISRIADADEDWK